MPQSSSSKKSPSIRLMNYITLYNQLFPYNPKNCLCIPEQYNKSVIGSDSPSIRQPYKYRVSYLCRNARGGTTQYGNNYLGQPVQLNYLGRGEGMPGGSGMPPKNMFN
jgi:hypothetical protein